jgi:hypothetical protein
VPHGAPAARRAVRQKCNRNGSDDQRRGDVRARRRDEAELSLLKNDRPIAEEQPKERLEHPDVPVKRPRAAIVQPRATGPGNLIRLIKGNRRQPAPISFSEGGWDQRGGRLRVRTAAIELSQSLP